MRTLARRGLSLGLLLGVVLGSCACNSPATEQAASAADAPTPPPPRKAPASPFRPPRRANELAAVEVPVWGVAVPVGCRVQAHWDDWQDYRCSAPYSTIERFYLRRYPNGKLRRGRRGARFDPRIPTSTQVRLQRLRGSGSVRLMVFRGLRARSGDAKRGPEQRPR